MRVVKAPIPRHLRHAEVRRVFRVCENLNAAVAIRQKVKERGRSMRGIVNLFRRIAQPVRKRVRRLFILRIAGIGFRIASLLLLQSFKVVHTGPDHIQGNRRLATLTQCVVFVRG